jgi:signal transduction histidine kinase
MRISKKAILVFFLVFGLWPNAILGQAKKTSLSENLASFNFKNQEQLDSAFLAIDKISDTESIQKGKCYYMLGKKYYGLAIFDKAKESFTKSITVLSKHPEIFEYADSYHLLGLNAVKLKQFDVADSYFDKCIQISTKNKDTLNIISGLHGKGNLLIQTEQYQEAETSLQKALELGLKINDSLSYSYSYDFLSQLAGQVNKPKEALDYQLKSMRIREKINDKFGLAISLNNVGECYRLLEEKALAEKYFIDAQKLASSIGFRDLENYIFQILTELAEERGNYPLALEYSKKHKALSDSLFNEKMLKEVADIEGKYQLTEKEKELSEQVIKNQKLSIYILLFLLELLFAAGWAYRINLKKKEERILMEREAKQKLENERVRIARDLHDHLGPELSMISSRLDIMSFKNQSDSFSNLANVTRGAMDQLRDTIWSIRGEAITIEDFAAKVQEFALKRLDGLNIKYTTEASKKEELLSPNQALNLFRVCQEAINNAAKYAESSIIELKVNATDNIYLELSDNGKGFEDSTKNKGYGLRNMRERLEELDGNLDLISTNKGTKITCRLPLFLKA